MTKVVNLRKDKYDVYIGRAGRGKDGYFGNPIRIGQACPTCGEKHTKAGETIPCYRKWFNERIASDSEFKQKITELKGKTLGCFCKPNPCHGDIIAEYLDREET